MLKVLSGITTFLSLLLIAAHFLRAGNLILAITFVCLFILWFFKNNITKKILQATLLAGILVYIYTTYILIRERIYNGLPFTKTLAIMSGVTGFIFLSFILLTKLKHEEQ
ncbi:hypothetical protein [Desulfurobacterium sp.]